MQTEPHSPSGHDGPYDSPIEVRGFRVKPEWIDYNGHMNVGYYGVAFDEALEGLLCDHLGLGEPQVRAYGQGPYILQSHLHFVREVTASTPFYFRFRLLDADHKRGHYFAQLLSEDDDVVCATQEALFMNVSHSSGRSVPYPDWAVARMARMVTDHAGLEPAPQIAQPMGIRRKSSS
ncbi:MAG: thioesterase family protein [Pseudomonadota bacterium]